MVVIVAHGPAAPDRIVGGGNTAAHFTIALRCGIANFIPGKLQREVMGALEALVAIFSEAGQLAIKARGIPPQQCRTIAGIAKLDREFCRR
jgi:hypothetical protein